MIIVIVLAGILIAAWDTEALEPHPVTSETRWRSTTFVDNGSLAVPVVLEDAVIRRQGTLLAYYPLDDRPPIIYEWVTGIPQNWAIAPTETNYHLIWLTVGGELWRSQINLAGEQTLAVLPVASSNVRNFAVSPLSRSQTLLIWQTTQEFRKPVFGLVLDEWGRPFGNEQVLIEDADHVALGVNGQMAWVVGTQLHYGVFAESRLTESQAWTLTVPDGTWIDSLYIISDAETLTLLWGIVDIQSPEHTTYFGRIVGDELSEFSLVLADAPLRWIGSVYPENLGYVALTAFLDDAWRPVLLHLAEGEVRDYQVLSGVVADAGPPRVWLATDGKIVAAWAYLDGWDIVQHVATDNSSFLSLPPPPEVERMKPLVALLAGLLSIPYGAFWLLAAFIMWHILSAHSWQLRLLAALATYWAVKAAFRWMSLFALPEAWSDMTSNPALLVGSMLTSGAVVAFIIAWLIARYSHRERFFFTFLIADALLTCVLFGVNLTA